MLKKWIATFLLGALVWSAVPASVHADEFPQTGEEFGEALALWFPNLVLDALDTFTVQVGIGPVLGLEARITRACELGLTVGRSYMLSKAYNRQIGWGIEEGQSFSAACFTKEDRRRFDTSRYLCSYETHVLGMNLPDETLYDFYEGERDYWAVELDAALGVQLNAGVHIIEAVDFITGIFLVDLRGDNLKFEDFE